MKTTAEFPVDAGTVVEVACSNEDDTLMGDNKVTCAFGRDYTYLSEPWCSGEHSYYQSLTFR